MSPQGPSPSPPARPTPLPVVTHAPAHTHSVFPVPPRLMCIRPAHLSVPHQPVGQGRVQAGSPSVSLPARPWPQGTIQQLAGFSVVPGTVLNPHARPVPQPHRSAPALLMRVHACVLLSPSFRDRDTKAWRWTALAQGHMVGGGGALLIDPRAGWADGEWFSLKGGGRRGCGGFSGEAASERPARCP